MALNDKIPVPTWSEIHNALLSIPQLSLKGSNIGEMTTTQRLSSQDFEMIFYNIFLKLDPSTCRRNFRNLYPSRDKQDQARFFEIAVNFINDKHILSQRIAKNQLMMLGGEPFRRILASLIKAAIKLEIEAIKRKLSSHVEIVDSPTLDRMHNALQWRQNLLKDKIEELMQLNKRHKQIHEDLSVKKHEIVEKWKLVSQNIQPAPAQYDRATMKLIYKQLLDRLERANCKFKISSHRVATIPRPPDGEVSVREEKPKRMSQTMKELRKCLESSPEDSPCTTQVKLSNKLLHKFNELEFKMTSLLDELEEIRLQVDEDFIGQPEIFKMYQYYENLIPYIDPKPIGYVDPDGVDATSQEIEDILRKYSR